MKISFEEQSATKGREYLLQVMHELLLARDLNTVMDIVCIAARRLASAEGATFVLKVKDQCHYAGEDAMRPLFKGSRFPMITCISGWVMLNNTHVSIPDISRDSRIAPDIYNSTFIKGLAMVPIVTLEPIGAIGTYWADVHTPSDDEVRSLQSLADATALALENVKVYDELKQQVQDRTMELKSANKSLEAYSHSISHDLRAPLRSIKGFFEILHDSIKLDLDQYQQETANRIFSNVNHMEKMLDGLLAFSKMGKQKLRRSMVKMEELVTDICEYFQSLEPSRDIQFRIASLPQAEADPLLMSQVWTNLLSNAVKYTGKKAQARIDVGFETNVDSVVYFVRDNGAGFDKKYAERLFGVFQRMHNKREFEGIGIGLSIVEQIILKHEGKVWVDAAVNEGATFYFQLPNRNEIRSTAL